MTGRLSSVALRPLAGLYLQAIGRRNAKFDRGEGVVTFDGPVISVGNLSVGGTGKTPMVRMVIELLRREGHDPCIAMRGYGSSRRADGRSDEAEEYARVFDDLPIVAQPQRSEGLIELFGTERGQRVDSIVLDDGFQHRRIARDLDIVLIDATRDPRHDHPLPLGRLRESITALARAHAVVITHAEQSTPQAVDDLLRACAAVRGGLILAAAEHAWAGLDLWHRGDRTSEPPAWLTDRRVLVVCAIGNPSAFVEQARAVCGSVVGSVVLRDHDPFRPAMVRRIRAEAEDADVILTTGKDWAKLSGEDPMLWPCPVAVPRLEMRLSRGGAELDAAILAAAQTGSESHGDRLAP